MWLVRDKNKGIITKKKMKTSTELQHDDNVDPRHNIEKCSEDKMLQTPGLNRAP